MERLILILMVLINSCAFAAIGTITENEKEPALITRESSKLEGKKGSTVEMNDIVNTAKGIVGITFEDQTKVNITENSKLVIDDFVYDPKKGAGKLGIKVALGTVRYASGAIAHNNPNSVAIKTPTSTIAVRGTDFLMSVDEIGRSMIILLPQCDDMGSCKTGIIDVETPAGVVTLNQANQATMVDSANGTPTPPVIINLDGRPLNNTLQVSSPKTAAGVSFASEARSQKSSAQAKANTVSEAEAQVVIAEESNKQKEIVKVVAVTVEKEVEKIAKESSFSPVFGKDGRQLAWNYEHSSTSNKNYSNVMLNPNSDVIINVVQDYVSDPYILGKGNGGIITIQQITK